MSRYILTRPLRNPVRAACTNAPGWAAWRAANMPGRDSGNMSAAEIVRAAADLGVDVPAVAASAGIALTYFADNAPATHEEPETMTAATSPHISAASAFEGKAAPDVAREALAAAEGMIGPKLFDMLMASVTPLAEAATAGPRTVTVDREVIRTVTVRAPGEAGDAAPARLCQLVDVVKGRDLLGVKAAEAGTWRAPLDADLSRWDGTPAEGVPVVDPHHVWHAEALACLCIAARHADAGTALRNASRVLFYGPAGTGKTTTAMQFAARTGRPFIRLPFDRTTEPAELVGQRMPKAGGGTEYREGALVAAMQVPGAIVLLDEPSFLRPGAAAVLQTILDTGVVYLKEDGNRRVELAPGVIIVAADNTNLAGDTTGRYADTIAQNVALSDRFAFMVALDYLSEKQEAGVLVARTGIPVAVARNMVAFAATTRKGAATGQLTTGCSLRRLMAWGIGLTAGIPSAHAFKASVLNPADASDHETLRGLERTTADHVMIDAVMSGTIPGNPDVAGAAPTGATVTPAGASAAAAFASAPIVNP